MPIYVSHVTLTREGLQELKSAPDRVEANRNLWEEAGGKLLEWYIVLPELCADSAWPSPMELWR